MPQMRVTKLAQSKSGKPIVFFDGKEHWKDQYFLGKTAVPRWGR